MCMTALSSALFGTISFLCGAVTSEEGLFESVTGFGLGGFSMVLFLPEEVEVFNPAKAADVGADIIDKVERNIPDDDPRIERFDAICFSFCFKKFPTNVMAYSGGKIAGMGYDLIGLYAESTFTARIFGSISSFGINHNWNVLSFAH
ncbi:hypothetical protein RHSIM_RhsimUnG0114500 [Rhododendron simsii]|uniref:H(+)-exporting diphosphatase n=1 Tax=Rhododendron simsii TaxID=118357 RepID=A0A834L4W2_RHOSS|nr:hypothetical protein RHSIM_RhsimUnG0114500 [Rhododendron simsii]